MYPRAYKYLQDQRLKLQFRRNRELGSPVEDRLLASEILGDFGMFWSRLDAEILALQLHLVTTIYVERSMAAEKAEC